MRGWPAVTSIALVEWLRRHCSSAANLQKQLDGGTRELAETQKHLAEALEQQIATSEILGAVARSATDVQIVLDAVCQSAARLCEAYDAAIWRPDGDQLLLVAHHGPITQVGSIPLVRGSVVGRAVLDRQTVHIADIQSSADEFPITSEYARRLGFRTGLWVPLLREGAAIGTIALRRTEVQPFTERQVALLQTFADQAVIAIENARLLNELRQRTTDLSEALERQTATAEVLQVISSSPGELEPVFQAMLVNATRICEAQFGNLFLREEHGFRVVAMHGPTDYIASRERDPVVDLREHPHVPLARTVQNKGIVHIQDIRSEQAYIERDPLIVALTESAGARTLLIVPMLRDEELIGAIVIYRQEVRPFTDKQIELLKNFATQAVIAIENTRLLNELRESLQQQTATSEVLRVISSSPGDLEPVFQTLLKNATLICEAKVGVLMRFDGEAFSCATHLGTPAALVEFMQRGPFRPPPGSHLDHVMRTKQVSHTADYAADGVPAPPVTLGGARSTIDVPMLKDDELIGAFSIYRQEVRPFTEQQIALLTNFADQAVIAIENTRLLNELRESLQQQTATSEVLQIISSSPGELEPVFQALLENAVRICEAKFGTLFRYDGNNFHRAAGVGTPAALVEFQKQRGPFRPESAGVIARVLRTKQVAHSADSAAEPNPGVATTLGGARSIVGVPMLKDGELVGAIVIYRQEVRPFPDKQIDLVSNFAKQAVIAIENTRLLNELRESLQQQTTTAGVLQVISPLDLRSAGRARYPRSVSGHAV